MCVAFEPRRKSESQQREMSDGSAKVFRPAVSAVCASLTMGSCPSE